MIYQNIILIYLISTIFCQSPTQIINQLNARLQCEYKDFDGESLILNCTLTNGLVIGQEPGVLLNSESTQTSTIHSLSLRVGIEANWRTPWESLSINPNIIRTIIWRNSKISEMGEYSFKDLRYLQRIDLSFNKLTNLKSYVFSYFEIDLLELDLSHNFFQAVPHDIFENKRLQYLETLRLNENPITNLNRESFEKIQTNIKTIELNYCKIRSIEPNTFTNMRQLDSLSLIGNHLRTLDYNNFKKLNLRLFYIHENPFNCDCNLRWLLDYIKNIEYQQQMYEAPNLISKNQNSYLPKITVSSAVQQFLKCDQPNSLKSRQNFLEINPDSFMCDIQIQFRDHINEANYEIGDDALLICDVYGDPEPEVYWSYGQKPIGKGLQNVDEKYYVNEVRLIPNPRNVNMYSFTNKTSELRIKNLQLNDFGMYTCTAEIKGSNNRKIIGFNLKQVSRKNLGLISATEFFISHLNKMLAYLRLNEIRDGGSVSNSTFFISFIIMTFLVVIIITVTIFTIWKCCCSKSKKRITKKLIYKSNGQNKEKEMANLIANSDVLDTHCSNIVQQNYSHLTNDSSATLLSSNKISNSIRMAYPNINEIYANHSLLTTTSATTGSTYPTNHIAIDTSSQNPKYHLLPQQNMDSYYDDLRFNCDDSHQVNYASPYRPQNSYSPIVRRDDPTVPLYATLKPKMGNPQHQRQYSSNYLQYSTIHRSTPPLPAPRRVNNYITGQIQLPPPPPPPPPVIPPTKPKRTFEYSKELQSDSGSFLLAEEVVEQSDCDINYQTYKRIKRKPTKTNVCGNHVPNSSTTSLDEEDLDLNDLKDFEDVTFDNLRKPNENEQCGTNRFKQHMNVKKNQLIILQQGLKKNLLDHGQTSTNSEQSLLLKSSSSSSDKSSSNPNLNPTNNESSSTVVPNQLDKNQINYAPNLNENEKIYEETEI